MKVSVYIIAVLCAISCSNASDKIKLESSNLPFLRVQVSSEFRNVSIPDSEVQLPEIIDSITLVPICNDSVLIGNVDQAVFIDSLIYILDKSVAQGVFAFDQSGHFRYQIGNLGRAAGEYSAISSCIIERGMITILDWQTCKYIKYSLSGDLISESNIMDHSPKDIVRMPSGKMIFNYESSLNRHPYYLAWADSLGRESMCAIGNRHPGIGRLSEVSISENGILYHYSQNDTIYSLLDNEIEAKYVIPIHDYDTEKYLDDLLSLPVRERLIKENTLSMESVFPGIFRESGSHCVYTYRKGKSIMSIIYDKNSNKSSKVRIADLSKHGAAFQLPGNIIGLCDSGVVTAIDAINFQSMTDGARECFLGFFKDPTDIAQYLSDINNNPALCVLHLK